MKKILFVLLLSSFALITSGQNQKFNLGLVAQLNRTYLTLNSDFNLPDKFKKNDFGIDFGGILEYQLKPKWEIRSGVIASINKYNYLGTDNRNPMTGPIVSGANIDSIDALVTLTSIKIPITMKYILFKNFFVNGGISFHGLINSKEKGEILNGDRLGNIYENNLFKINSFNISTILSIGYSFPLSENLNFLLEPSFEYFLTENELVTLNLKSNFYNIGGAVGLYFRL